jgi:acyl-CoA thioesterase-1
MRGKKAENCAGTTNGVKHVERWLALEGGGWDVVHFNFGLHDLKRVDAKTGKASGNPKDPRQAEPAAYGKQLRAIVAALKKTRAKLVFATTTPVPPGGVRPHRDPEDPPRYNAIARTIMEEHGVAVNDLHAFALPRLKKIQQPVNVHFTKDGSRLLGEEVARHIRKALGLSD